MESVTLLNLALSNVRFQQLLDTFERGLLITSNVDHIVKLQNDRKFYEICRQAEFVVPDSQIVMFASRFLGRPLKERINGADFFSAFYRYHHDHHDISVFLLGGKKMSHPSHANGSTKPQAGISSSERIRPASDSSATRPNALK